MFLLSSLFICGFRVARFTPLALYKSGVTLFLFAFFVCLHFWQLLSGTTDRYPPH